MPVPGTRSQLQQQSSQLSLHQWHAQQVKAYQQQLLEQQLFAQSGFASQQAAFTHYDRDEVPLAQAHPVCMPAPDMHHASSAQEVLMQQQVLYQQMHEAALAQLQQQQMKSTVSAGALNLMQQQQQASDCDIPPSYVDQMTAMRRVSEGQVLTKVSAASVSASVDTVTSIPPRIIPASSSSVTTTADSSSSECRDELFKVPFPPDHVRHSVNALLLDYRICQSINQSLDKFSSTETKVVVTYKTNV